MNKAKYVEKMTDLVEETLQRKGVSEDFTICDNYDEDGDLSMTLSYDHSNREETYQLAELYRTKKESDVKVKDQYNENFKERVEAFVERELNLRNERLAAYDGDGNGLDDEEDEDEDYYANEDYYSDDDDDYEDEEDEDEDEDEEEEADTPPAREIQTVNLEQTEQSDSEPAPAVSSAVVNFFKPLSFVDIAGNGSAKAAVLPPSMQKKSTGEIAKRYQNQIKTLFADGAIVAHPNANDVVVFDMSVYEATEVLEMLPEMSDEDGDLKIAEVENDEEKEL